MDCLSQGGSPQTPRANPASLYLNIQSPREGPDLSKVTEPGTARSRIRTQGVLTLSPVCGALGQCSSNFSLYENHLEGL